MTYTDYKHDEIDGPTEVGATFKTNADFFGGEGLLHFHLLPATVSRPVAPPDRKGVKAVVTRDDQGRAVNPNDLYLELRADYFRAEERDTGERLPRITPLRVGVRLGFTGENFTAKVEGIRVNHQYRVAQFGTASPGDAFLNASASYRFTLPAPGAGCCRQ